MRLRILLLPLALIAVMLASCAASQSKASGSPADSDASMMSARTDGESTSDSFTSALKAPESYSMSGESLETEAERLGSTQGRVALSIIINRLDGTQTVENLAGKKSQELFTILKNAAAQKSQTLEGLDRVYDLSAILASEGIYVTIQANDVSSAAGSSGAKADWVSKFEASISSAG